MLLFYNMCCFCVLKQSPKCSVTFSIYKLWLWRDYCVMCPCCTTRVLSYKSLHEWWWFTGNRKHMTFIHCLMENGDAKPYVETGLLWLQEALDRVAWIHRYGASVRERSVLVPWGPLYLHWRGSFKTLLDTFLMSQWMWTVSIICTVKCSDNLLVDL